MAASVARLHAAATKNDVQQLARLLEEPDSDVDASYQSRTALHCAAKGGAVQATALLLERRADVSARATRAEWHAIHLAAEAGSAAIVALLLDHGADLHATAANGTTALHFAAFNGRVAATKLLVARGIDVLAKAHDGYTALEDAQHRGVLAPPPSCSLHGA